MTETPDSPVTRVEVEHEDGTVRVLEGEEAQAWVRWIGSIMGFAEEYGGKAPSVSWEQYDDNE